MDKDPNFTNSAENTFLGRDMSYLDAAQDPVFTDIELYLSGDIMSAYGYSDDPIKVKQELLELMINLKAAYGENISRDLTEKLGKYEQLLTDDRNRGQNVVIETIRRAEVAVKSKFVEAAKSNLDPLVEFSYNDIRNDARDAVSNLIQLGLEDFTPSLEALSSLKTFSTIENASSDSNLSLYINESEAKIKESIKVNAAKIIDINLKVTLEDLLEVISSDALPQINTIVAYLSGDKSVTKEEYESSIKALKQRAQNQQTQINESVSIYNFLTQAYQSEAKELELVA